MVCLISNLQPEMWQPEQLQYSVLACPMHFCLVVAVIRASGHGSLLYHLGRLSRRVGQSAVMTGLVPLMNIQNARRASL